MIENLIGLRRNLHRCFPVIDRFANGVATSIKSINLASKTYKTERALKRLIEGYVKQLAKFATKEVGRQTVNAADISKKVLHLVTNSEISPTLLQRLRTFPQNEGVEITTEIPKVGTLVDG